MANIVIYGAEISGICAAIKARGNLLADNQEHNIKIIVTNPSGKLGGLATRGGLNCWDVFNSPLLEYDRTEYNNGYDSAKCCQKGTFGYLFKTHLQSYRSDMKSTAPISGDMESMDEILLDYLPASTAGYNNNKVDIEIIPAMDIVDIDFTAVTDENNETFKTINKLYLRSVYRSEDGYIRWGRKTRVVEGDYFIDASDDGKLTSALTAVTVGRYDWPESTLENCEKTNIPVARQQAATLYFQVENMRGKFITEEIDGIKKYKFIPWGDNKEVRNLIKGSDNSDNAVYTYNKNHRNNDTPFLIKKYNLAKNSHLTTEGVYWANTFLIFNVDGRAHYRDFTTKFYPKYMLSDSIMRDEAWVKARNEIGTAEFLTGLRGFSGFEQCNIVTDNGYPVVAEQLYIRESVHLPLDATKIDNDTEADIITDGVIPGNYAVMRNHTLMKYQNGVTDLTDIDEYPDSDNKNSRIGLVSYNADIHPYIKGDVISPISGDSYTFLDMDESANLMRPDLTLSGDEYYIKRYAFKDEYNNDGVLVVQANTQLNSRDVHGSAMPASYLPYEAILVNNVENLLVAGNAMSVCSFSWGEVRVLPNLCVAGDAAGIAIAYAIRNNVSLKQINNPTDLVRLRKILAHRTENPVLFDDGTTEQWWTNDVIVDKTDVVKRGHKHGSYLTDNVIT